jgi:glycosyltransferase involved in cell wall biosynthesis
MNSIGVFLGIKPSSGGMFQYAQSILDGLLPLLEANIQVRIAFVGQEWQHVLTRYPAFEKTEMKYGETGLLIASGIMAMKLPGSLARTVSRIINPMVSQMWRMDCALWIFPSQDNLGYQVPFPVIVSIHDLMHRYEKDFPEVSAFGRYGLREHRFKNLVKWAQLVLVDSFVGKRHVMESYKADSDRVQPLPYVAPQYICQPEPVDFDQIYKLPKKFIFYPAQFWAHKNHKRLISAAVIARSRCPDISLVFTGRHLHCYASLLQHADELGMTDCIVFPGYVQDVYLSGFYRRARALVMPTFFGPTNIPPLEAFTCGCPVAVSDIYGMSEQARGCALLFDPSSVSDIAATIERLWLDDDLCRDLSERSIAYAAYWNKTSFSQALTKHVRQVVQNL